jgi:hypothetical protein
MKLSGAQFQQTILITICSYLILNGLTNILEIILNKTMNATAKVKAWSDHLFSMVAGITVLMVLMNKSNSVSTMRILSIILGLLLAIHAVAMFMHNDSSYKGQNLVVATFYIIFSVVFIGSGFIIDQSGGGANYSMYA